jgi:hypothetical protein
VEQLGLLSIEEARRLEGIPEPRARRSDPGTSHQAAKRAAGIAPNHRNLIMAALDHGPQNIYELGARTQLTHVQVARRMLELQDMKLAHPTGERRDGCRLWAKGPA